MQASIPKLDVRNNTAVGISFMRKQKGEMDVRKRKLNIIKDEKKAQIAVRARAFSPMRLKK